MLLSAAVQVIMHGQSRWHKDMAFRPKVWAQAKRQHIPSGSLTELTDEELRSRILREGALSAALGSRLVKVLPLRLSS